MAVRIQDGTGNSLTSTANALDINVKSSSGTTAISGTVAVSNFPSTQAVSAVSLPLPTGASTVAKQPALGIAGTPSADVITVQGAASMTALKVDGSAVTQPVSGTVSVGNFPATQPISGAVSVSNFPATQPVSGTITANAGTGNFTVAQATGTNLHTVVDSGSLTATQATAANLNATVVGSGNFTVVQGTGTNLHTVVDSGTVTAVTTITNAVKVTGNAGATLDTTLSTGAAPTNVIYTTSTPKTVAAGAYSAAFRNASGAAVNIKASAGNLYGFSITNETAAVAYIEFFNTASAPTLGTTAVVFAIKLPASANITIPPGDIALMNFSTGIGFAVTTTENGSTTASVTGMIFYQ